MFFKRHTKINLKSTAMFKETVSRASNLLLVTHKNPDGDAIGSITAMINYLHSLNKGYQAFCYDALPPNLEYLTHAHEITHQLEKINRGNVDALILLDCSDLKYSGIGEYIHNLTSGGVPLINIDHHWQSDYGDINITDSAAASTSLILYDLFNRLGVRINKSMATSLLAGILVDTNSFSNSAASSQSFAAAAALLSSGAGYLLASRALFQPTDLRELKVWAKVLSRLAKNDKLKVAYTFLLEDDSADDGQWPVDGVANFFNHLGGVKLSLVLREKENREIKVSLRSNHERIDVAALARLCGGGGHKKAAGFSVRGRLEWHGHSWQVV